jgi:hypothetical protein
LDEQNDIYMRAVALEERASEDDDDLEGALPPRPVSKMHTIKISLAIVLVILTQSLGISKVSHIALSILAVKLLTGRQIIHEYTWDGNYMCFMIVRGRYLKYRNI